jgi:hypothetical protein
VSADSGSYVNPEPNAEYERLAKAARPFSGCTHDYAGIGYGPITCLEMERMISDPSDPKWDWWPFAGPCDGCELRRILEP